MLLKFNCAFDKSFVAFIMSYFLFELIKLYFKLQRIKGVKQKLELLEYKTCIAIQFFSDLSY